MIQLSGVPYQTSAAGITDKSGAVIIEALQKSPTVYSFSSQNELLFEINARKNIITSAKAMADGQAVFATFRNSRCNPEYWQLTKEGGFLLKREFLPADAIRDIFQNSSLYKFECATSCVIIFYHGVLQTMGSTAFNTLFPNLYLYSWHTDDDLGLHSITSPHPIPGDVVYFVNPDVNPKTPWFRGENAILMEDGRFFGHGFGIRTAEKMIEGLNRYRKPETQQSAYLTNLITRPSFRQLARFTNPYRDRAIHKTIPFVIHHNRNSISYSHYLFELSYHPTR